MLSLERNRRYFWYRGVCDMRKSFRGLCYLAETAMKGKLLSGDVFIFVNRRCNRMKLLVWDRDGFVIWYKHLEEGTFEVPRFGPGGNQLGYEELMLVLQGVRLSSVKRRKRYRHPRQNVENLIV